MSERRTRILGKMLSQYIGKNVIVVGHVTKVSASGECVELTTFDKIKINVNLPSPLDLSVGGIMEVSGIAKSKGTIEADQCVHFEEENSKDFDTKAYNDLIIILHANQGERWKFDDNMNGL